MRYLSVCSGIEAATVAWHSLGWQPYAFSEIEPFPSAVLKHHYPDVPNYGDMTKFKEWPDEPIDLLCGGTPCQSFSVAGLRKGLDDPRGNLALTFLAIADHYKPKWIVWENVPGVLSSNKGKDFESFLDGLEELGYILDCDILDAQFHGVAQRRRRVFVCAQHRDYLLKNKTSLSALTIAQCWQEILLSLLAKAWSESGKEQQNLGLPLLSNDGAIRRMRLFGLAGETDCYEILRENLVEAFLKLPPEQSDWDAVHGKLGKEPIHADLWTDFPKDDLSTLTEQSLKKALDESYEVMKSCITSTTTNSITTFQIYTSFRAALVIAKLIQRLNPSSPPFWSAATSALTAIQEYTNYARQTDSKLLGEVVGIQDWLYLIEQAERTAESLGDIAVECFGKVFPVSQSLSWHPAPRREAGQEVAATAGSGTQGGGSQQPIAARMVAFGEYVDDGTASAMKARDYKDATDLVAQPIPLNSMTFGRANEKTNRQCLGVGAPGDPAPTLSKTHHHAVAQPMVLMNQGGSVMNVMQDGTVGTLRRETHGHEPVVMQPIAFDSTQITSKQNYSNPKAGEPCHPLASRAHPPAIASSMAVRRLTPVECERLQGFPDNYTNIPWRNKNESPDGLRYKALGNSMAVPVMKWIGERIKMVDELC